MPHPLLLVIAFGLTALLSSTPHTPAPPTDPARSPTRLTAIRAHPQDRHHRPVAPIMATTGSHGKAPSAAPGRFTWPLGGPPPPVLRRFDPPPQPWLAGHRGVDLGAPPGATVRSAGGGIVVFAGLVAGRGVVSVEHPGGLRTTYQPLHIGIATGRPVTTGTPVGTLAAGHPGCPAAACVHWGLRRGAEYLDPLSLLALGRVRLLPPTAG